jgi:UDP-2,3-diacylglucosamine hydrolase
MMSETEKRHKPAEIMDVNADAVTAWFVEHRAEALIHGHTHRQGRHEHVINGKTSTRWVLGDWHLGKLSVLSCAPSDCHFFA